MSTEPTAEDMTPEYFAERVAAGIALMEQEEPGSADRIELAELDVWSTFRCPLARGIGDGSYGTGARRLGLDECDDREMAAHGFTLTSREILVLDEGLGQSGSEMYAPLTEAWRAALLRRRAQAPA